MKRSSLHTVIRSSSKAVIAIISIFSIFLSLFQPVFAVQAAAPLDQTAGLDQDNISLDKSFVGAFKVNTSLTLAPTGPDAPDWPPIFTKKFNPNPIYVGEISTLTFTIVNEVWMDLEGSAFTDPLPAGVQVAANPAASSTCKDVRFNPTPGATVLTFFGTIPGRGSCTIQVNVTSSVPGNHYNITSELTTETGLIGAPASDTLIVLPRKADLAVTKTDGVDQVAAGGVTTYTVRVTNWGPATVIGAILVDTAGTGLVPTAVACSTAANNLCITPPLLVDLISTGISLPDLAYLQFYEIRLTANVTATSGTVANTATVLPPKDTIDPNLENNVATDIDTVVGELVADLEVTKTDGVDIILTGEITTYTVRVTNWGPATVVGANLYDTTDSGLTLLDAVCSTAALNTCVTKPDLALMMTDGITLPTLAPKQFYEIKLIARAADFSCITTNSAIVTPPDIMPDPDLSNNTAEDTNEVIPPPQANLAVTKNDGVTFVETNRVTTYTVRVTNIGPDAVTGATLIDSAGIGLTLTDVTCSAAEGNLCSMPPQLTDLTSTGAKLPQLNAGSFYEIRLTAIVTALSGSVINTTTITPPTGTADPNADNNYASDTNFVIISGTIPSDLTVSKEDGVTTLPPNSSTIYTIRVTNIGANSVSGAKLVDSIGSGLTPISVACSAASDNLCITPPLLADLFTSGISLPNLPSGQFYEIRLTANTTVISGSVTNTAIVIPSPSNIDINLDNNVATDTNTVSTFSPINLVVTKTDGVETVNVGGETIYTVRVTNNGPAIGSGTKLVDSAGIGLSLTSVACSTAASNLCITAPLLANLIGAGVSLPALPSGQFYEILVSARVTATSGSVTNTATITPPAGMTDTTPNDNSASDTNIIMLYHWYAPFVSSPAQDTFINWNTILGYEDLSLITGQNDYDYNDWTVAINGTLTYDNIYSNLVKSFSLSFTPLARGGTYDHTFQIRLPAGTLTSTGSAVINLYDQNHNLILRQVATLSSSAENIFVIFPQTSAVFPGSIVNTVEGEPTAFAQRYADLTVTLDTPIALDFSANDLTHPHGQNLFFDPTLQVINNGEEIHRGDVRLLNIPTSAYRWPEEGVRIDRAYPLITYAAGTPPTFTFPTSWWTVSNNCVFNGVACSTP